MEDEEAHRGLTKEAVDALVNQLKNEQIKRNTYVIPPNLKEQLSEAKWDKPMEDLREAFKEMEKKSYQAGMNVERAVERAAAAITGPWMEKPDSIEEVYHQALKHDPWPDNYWGTSMAQGWRNSWGNSRTRPKNRPLKRITSVNVFRINDAMTSTSPSSSPGGLQVYAEPRWEVVDQDGEHVPPELAKRIMDVFDGGDINVILNEYNAEIDERLRSEHSKPEGHKSKCLYLGEHTYPCNCQPDTLWGKTELWYCECCEQPRAEIRFGLCDLCEGHQYADANQASVEHEARSDRE